MKSLVFLLKSMVFSSIERGPKGEVHLILPEPLPNKISKSKNWCQRQSCAVFSTQTGMSVCPKINLFISEILAENPTVDVAWERDYLFKVTISKY